MLDRPEKPSGWKLQAVVMTPRWNIAYICNYILVVHLWIYIPMRLPWVDCHLRFADTDRCSLIADCDC